MLMCEFIYLYIHFLYSFSFPYPTESVLPAILEALCAEDPLKSLETKQALAKQFAEILQFVMRFDDMKMTNPAIQNDFSYYRRTLSRMKMTNPVSGLAGHFEC